MNRRVLPAVVTAAACIGATYVTGPGAAVAASTGIVKTAYFNHPLAYQTRPAGGPSEITAAIVRLLAEASNAATVRIAMYEATLSDDPTTSTVGDAALIEQQIVRDLNRGVHVSVVADNHKDHDFWDQVKADVAGTDAAPLFGAHYCMDSCYESGAGIMHNKFMMIDSLVIQGAPVTDVVVQSSANWRYAQLNTHYWNNAVEIDNDASLYNGYLSYYLMLHDCAVSAAQSCSGSPSANQSWAGDGNELVDILPQSSPDPVTAALNNVQHCDGPLDPQNAHTAIDIAMNSWTTDDRGSSILNKLRQFDQNACPVRIVVPASAPIASQLTGSDTLSLKAHCTGGGLTSPAEHNKYMLIDGKFGGSSGQVVFTGSHRFNTHSMTTDDEVWMRLESLTSAPDPETAALYAQYEDAFSDMWSASPPCSAVQLTPDGSDDDDNLDP